MATTLKKTPVRRTLTRKAAPKRGKPIGVNHRLGVLARDTVTGFEGVVTVRVEMLNGNVQFLLQPKGKKDAIADGKCIDFHLLEEIGAGVADKLPPIDQSATIKLGQRVRDRVSGLTGIVTEKTTFQNGCVYFAIQAHANRSKLLGEIPGSINFPHQRLEVRPTFGDVMRGLGSLLAKQFTPKPSVNRTQLRRVQDTTFGVTPAAGPKIAPPLPAPRPTGGPMRSMGRIA